MEPWHLSRQSSSTLTHSSSFQSRCGNFSCSLSSLLRVAFLKTQGWRVRKPGCNKPVTDGTSLRHRQEDLWQGPDADIKSQEMRRASPIATSPFCRSQSPPSSLCRFLSFLVTLSLHNALFHTHSFLRTPRFLSVVANSSSLAHYGRVVGWCCVLVQRRKVSMLMQTTFFSTAPNYTLYSTITGFGVMTFPTHRCLHTAFLLSK